MNSMRQPHRQSGGFFAGYFVDGDVHPACVRNAEGVAPAAAIFIRRVGNGAGIDERRPKRGFALRHVGLQCGKAEIEKPALGFAQVDGGKRIETRRYEPEPEGGADDGCGDATKDQPGA